MTDVQPRILVIHGPNLNLLGQREPHVYGATTLEEINRRLLEKAERLKLAVEPLQTNHEGVMVEAIQKAVTGYAGIIINPAAFSHYSIAVRDALAAVPVPVIEVHLSNIHGREEFRRHSVTAPVVKGCITGLGPSGYLLALEAIARMMDGRDSI
ncbi:MAG TPA: type II 3-dehydroquinate dehydratase [Selenomonadales bacterium]|nr:type II 3-dehydroquinate dehydratase [Selenomonadales bacterium]